MSAAEALGLPPGVRFDPTDEELVESYLLPRALGRPPAVPGVIIEADAAAPAASHPWKLLTRHHRTADDEAYWFEGISTTSDAGAAGGGARQACRSCGRRWTWVGQRRCPDEALVLPGGERVSWSKYALNLQEGRGKRGGSTGWVLHEYTVSPSTLEEGGTPLPVKLCHVAFTGHGQKRQRVPDDDDDGDGKVVEGQEHHKRAATASSSSSVVTTAAAAADQEERLLSSYGASSDGDFGGSDAGFSQESFVLNNPRYPDAGSSNKQPPWALDQELAPQNQESLSFTNRSQEQLVNFGASSAGDFWGSNAGFSQESCVLDTWCPEAAGSSQQQQPLALDQELARNQELPPNLSQEQLMDLAGSSIGDYCTLLHAQGLGSSQEPPAGQFLTYEQQLLLELAQLLGDIDCSPPCPPSSPAGSEAAYHEEHIKTPAMAGLPVPTDQESCTTEQPDGDIDNFFAGWGDLDSFCDTTGVQDDDDDDDVARVVEAQPVSGAKRKLNFDLDRHFSDQQKEIF
ncbi:unnamed protein product [Urochloa decumbens]|uniref:NAC domain-containing protein n=1 Tax=Urochloa decumbens TaxID=240449 RepID=A0ABC8YEN3_9POAL